MRTILVATAVSVALTGSCWAGDEIMKPYFGNTIVIKNAFGFEIHAHYSPDHTMTQTVNGANFKGVWQLSDGKLCRTLENPPPFAPNPFCLDWEIHKIGDTWTKDGNTVTLLEGIQ